MWLIRSLFKIADYFYTSAHAQSGEHYTTFSESITKRHPKSIRFASGIIMGMLVASPSFKDKQEQLHFLMFPLLCCLDCCKNLWKPLALVSLLSGSWLHNSLNLFVDKMKISTEQRYSSSQLINRVCMGKVWDLWVLVKLSSSFGIVYKTNDAMVKEDGLCVVSACIYHQGDLLWVKEWVQVDSNNRCYCKEDTCKC